MKVPVTCKRFMHSKNGYGFTACGAGLEVACTFRRRGRHLCPLHPPPLLRRIRRRRRIETDRSCICVTRRFRFMEHQLRSPSLDFRAFLSLSSLLFLSQSFFFFLVAKRLKSTNKIYLSIYLFSLVVFLALLSLATFFCFVFLASVDGVVRVVCKRDVGEREGKGGRGGYMNSHTA